MLHWIEGVRLIKGRRLLSGGGSLIREKSLFGIIVTLGKRTVGRRGRQNGCVWQSWQGYHLRVLSWSSFYTNVFRPFTKQNYCHACHTTFGVFFSLSSCCISSLIWTRGQALIRAWAPIREKRYNGYVVAIIFGMQVWSQVYLIRGGFTVVQVTVWEGWLSQLWGIGSSLFPELQRNFKRGR